MTQHSMPFFDSAEEATVHTIQASGKSFKQVGCVLWPEKSADAAATALRNALNANREEKLTFDQHLLIAKHCGRYDVLNYGCIQTSHAMPVLQTPAELTAKLQEALFARADELRGVLAQIEAFRPKMQAAT